MALTNSFDITNDILYVSKMLYVYTATARWGIPANLQHYTYLLGVCKNPNQIKEIVSASLSTSSNTSSSSSSITNHHHHHHQ